jgi:hypothetical protein
MSSPLLSFTFYVYTREIKEARQTQNWDAVFAGLTTIGIVYLVPILMNSLGLGVFKWHC